MNTKGQLLSAWCGIASIPIFFLGFWPLAHFFPPISPAWDAARVAEFYREHSIGIRLGSILILYSGALLMPFYAVISVQLKRIEGALPVMTYANLTAGTLAVVPFLPAAVFFCVATFRPERSAQEVLLLSDSAWILLFLVAPPAMIQFFVIGFAILQDRTAAPIYPRWSGFFTIWAAILGIPGNVIVLFKTGPFAWNGIFGFYIPATLFGLWTIVIGILTIKSINNQQAPVVGRKLD